MGNSKSYKVAFVILVLLLIGGCSKEEEKRWDFNEYVSIVTGDEFYGKYKDMSFLRSKRDGKDSYDFVYKDSLTVSLRMDKDYSYSVKSCIENISKDEIEMPDFLAETLKQVISDCKRLRVNSFSSTVNSFMVIYYMRNINLSTLPEELIQYDWISDSTMAFIEFGLHTKGGSGEGGVTIPLNDKWFFTAFKYDILDEYD